MRKANVALVRAGSTQELRITVRYDATKHVLTIDPWRRLAHRTTCKVTVGTGVTDRAGNRLDQKARRGLQAKTWRFTTR